jgi:hypothetical protein
MLGFALIASGVKMMTSQLDEEAEPNEIGHLSSPLG